MMVAPMISVIMPVYNAQRTVTDAVTSILEQSYDNFEFIIIDDCSQDQTWAILNELAAKDSRIKLWRNRANRKLPSTLNLAISKASGKYIARMDADDISLPNRLLIQLEFLEKNPEIGVCGSYSEIYDEDMEKMVGKLMYPTNHELITVYMHLLINVIVHPTVFMRSSLLNKDLRYSEKMSSNAEDYDLWLRMLANGVKFANIPETLLKYRSYTQQTSKINLQKINNWRRENIRSYLAALLQANFNEQVFKDYINLLVFPNKFAQIFGILKYVKLLRLLKKANAQNQIYEEASFNKFISEISVLSRIKKKLALK